MIKLVEYSNEMKIKINVKIRPLTNINDRRPHMVGQEYFIKRFRRFHHGAKPRKTNLDGINELVFGQKERAIGCDREGSRVSESETRQSRRKARFGKRDFVHCEPYLVFAFNGTTRSGI